MEVVRCLSWLTLLWMCLLVLVRLGGWETERPEAWREVALVNLPKNTDKVGFQVMRYISWHPVLQKLYVRAMQAAVRGERRPHQKTILGFEPRLESRVRCGRFSATRRSGEWERSWRRRL